MTYRPECLTISSHHEYDKKFRVKHISTDVFLSMSIQFSMHFINSLCENASLRLSLLSELYSSVFISILLLRPSPSSIYGLFVVDSFRSQFLAIYLKHTLIDSMYIHIYAPYLEREGGNRRAKDSFNVLHLLSMR